VELQTGTDASSFAKKLNSWQRNHFTIPYQKQFGKEVQYFDFNKLNWYIRPLAECHYSAAEPWGHYTNLTHIYVLLTIALVILMTTIFNYILLAISSSHKRHQEFSIKKILGANKVSLAIQFWIEAQIILLSSSLLGLITSHLISPFLSSLTGTEFRLTYLSWTDIFIIVLLFSLLLSIVASIYPSLLIMKLNPAVSIKRNGTFKMNPSFGRIMTVFQFTSSIILICCALAINLQVNYVTTYNLGFLKDGIVMVKNQSFDLNFIKKADAHFKEFARRSRYISLYSPINGSLTGDFALKNVVSINDKEQAVTEIQVGLDYFNMLSIPFIGGRSFSSSFTTDTSTSRPVSVVNESLFKLLGKDARIGVFNKELGSTVIGVTRDYRFDKLSENIQPLEHRLVNGYVEYYMFKYQGNTIREAIAGLKNEWQSLTELYPFEYTFMDESIASMYQEEQRSRKLIQYACLFAALIACMGLFGLSSVTVGNHKKDIAIQRVFTPGGAIHTDSNANCLYFAYPLATGVHCPNLFGTIRFPDCCGGCPCDSYPFNLLFHLISSSVKSH